MSGKPDKVDWIRRLLIQPTDQLWFSLAPAADMSRQQWQEIVEYLAAELRGHYSQPAFGVSEAEISMHYHLPAEQFVRLVRRRLGLNEGVEIQIGWNGLDGDVNDG